MIPQSKIDVPPSGSTFGALVALVLGINQHIMDAASLSHQGKGLPNKASPVFFVLFAAATLMHGLRTAFGSADDQVLSSVFAMAAYAVSAATILVWKDGSKFLRASVYFCATFGFDALAASLGLIGVTVPGSAIVIVGLASSIITTARLKEDTEQ